jgi:lipopolysaccharide biosynthesis glycosyltransferase
MDNQIKIVFCFDKNYIQYAKTAIKSLLKNKTRDIYIYMIVSGVKQEDLISIDHLLCAFDVKYETFYVDYSNLDFCKPMEHLKMPTYLRLLIPSLIPEKKIIYLDCDIYVNQDLGELFDLNIENNIVAAVPDVHAQDRFQKLGLKNQNYFNAGILRWDLEKIDRDGFINLCRYTYLKYEEALTFGDQCLLNIIYDEKKATLNREWNEQVIVHHCYYPTLEYFIEQSRKIIHFCGPVKPWECGFGNAGWKFWHKYMA